MELKLHSFPNSNTQYVAPSWDELDALSLKIAQGILADGHQIDRVVTLAKGGWPMTRSIVDYLSIDKVASIGVRFYSGINERLGKPEIYQDVPVSVQGENVLLFDDVADTGESLQYIKEYLSYKNVASITTATLFHKSQSVLTPDYIGSQTDAWIIFPFEKAEMALILIQQWHEAKVSREQMKMHLTAMQYPDLVIEHSFALFEKQSGVAQ